MLMAGTYSPSVFFNSLGQIAGGNHNFRLFN